MLEISSGDVPDRLVSMVSVYAPSFFNSPLASDASMSMAQLDNICCCRAYMVVMTSISRIPVHG